MTELQKPEPEKCELASVRLDAEDISRITELVNDDIDRTGEQDEIDDSILSACKQALAEAGMSLTDPMNPSKLATGKANPSPPTQPDRPYRAESAPRDGWDIYGPDGHEQRLHEITIPTYVNDLNAAYLEGQESTGDQLASLTNQVADLKASKDQVVEAAAKLVASLNGKNPSIDGAAVSLIRFNDLATALNPNSETENK